MIPTEAGAPFATLSPDLIVDAVEAAGFASDGRVLALGSYENRVFQVGLEDAGPVVVKFYRPGRWTDQAIAEEHAFARELAAAEIPVIAPLQPPRRDGLGDGPVPVFAGFRLAIYPRRGGQWPELGTPDDRQWIGRFLGRIHMTGGARPFQHRARLSPQAMGRESVSFLLAGERIPDYIRHRYERVAGELLDAVEARFEAVGSVRYLRIHGDCHRNNVLWTEAGPHFVDLDDCMMGPAVQDLWMLLAGPAAEMRVQLDDILEGYAQFANFDPAEVALIEPLRALRMVHYAAWLARRWHDPAFPRAFPWFGEARYWERHAAELEEQLGAM
ncbi:MAG: serine/threonine protein kinase [Steroidobacteraceae bacterium]|nr:serine/threonine protein kinase [Steroidobacteraceae bacterium]